MNRMSQEAVEFRMALGFCAQNLSRCQTTAERIQRIRLVLDWLRQEDVLERFDFHLADEYVTVRWVPAFPMTEYSRIFNMESMNTENLVIMTVMGS